MNVGHFLAMNYVLIVAIINIHTMVFRPLLNKNSFNDKYYDMIKETVDEFPYLNESFVKGIFGFFLFCLLLLPIQAKFLPGLFLKDIKKGFKKTSEEWGWDFN